MQRGPIFAILYGYAPVVQLDRTWVFQAEGRRFESCRARFFLTIAEFRRDSELPYVRRMAVGTMVGVAQLVEPRVVIPVVVGSSPIVHPRYQGR